MSSGRHARLGEGGRAAPSGRRVGQVDAARVAVLEGLAVAEDRRTRPAEVAGHVGVHDHERAAAVGDHAAVEPVERIGDERRGEDVVDRDGVAQQRVRVVLRVLGGGDLDPRQLLAGRAELVHVAGRRQGVVAHRGEDAGLLEARPRGCRRSAGRPRASAPPVRGRPARVMSATRHLPAAMAAAACPTWARYELPPVSVEST